jgi:hypothetical protein
MIRSEIATAVRQHLAETGTGEVTGTILLGAIGRACRRVNRDAKVNRGDATLSLASGVGEYAMPSGVLDVYRVRIGTARTKLDATNAEALDRDYNGWEGAANGTPSLYYTEGNLFGVYPKPTAAAATTAYVRGLLNVSAPANATGVPSWCPYAFHDTISKAAAIDIAGGFEAGKDFMDSRLEVLYREYLSEVSELKGLMEHRSTEQTPRLRPTGYGCYRRR